MLRVFFGGACIALTIILLVFLLPQTVFLSVDYYAELSEESTYHDFVYIETYSFSEGFRFRNYGRFRADDYIFFASYGDRFIPIHTTAGAFDTNRRYSIESLINNENYFETLRLEGSLRRHNLHVQSAIIEFVGDNNSDNIIFPYTLRIAKIMEIRGDIIVGLLILITPSILGAWLILTTVRHTNKSAGRKKSRMP